MKKALFIVSALLLVLAGCETVSKGADLVGGLTGRTGGVAGAVMAGEADFRSDEVLCAINETNQVLEASFQVAKILTPASAATKNQAEVIFLNGKKAWTNFVVPSHRATNAEIKVGAPLLYNQWAGTEKLSVDDYRQGTWHWGNVTSVDEMFKGIVEVKGDKLYIKNCRFPNQSIQ